MAAPLLVQVWCRPDSERNSRVGRKPIDAVDVQGALYNLPDDQVDNNIVVVQT